jgi:hypothetical protein
MAKYVNIMNFEIRMRQFWLPGQPAVTIPAHGIIEGPEEMLKTFSFLRPFYNNTQPSPIIPNNIPEEKKDVIRNNILAEKYGKTFFNELEKEGVINTPQQLEKESAKNPTPEKSFANVDDQVVEMPFDITNVESWVDLTREQVTQAANILKLDVASVTETGRKRKWAIIKLIKKYIEDNNL